VSLAHPPPLTGHQQDEFFAPYVGATSWHVITLRIALQGMVIAVNGARNT